MPNALIHRLTTDLTADTGAATHPTAASSASLPPAHLDPADLHIINAVLTEQIQLFEAALENMNQGLCMFGADSRLVVSNPRYRELFNMPPESIRRGMTQEEICSLLIARGSYPSSVGLDEIRIATRVALQHDDGLPVLRELADGRVLSIHYRMMKGGGWVSTFEDITAQRRSEAQIAHLAQHDALTDLRNVRAMRGAYHSLLAAVVYDRPLLGICYIDLDRFKFVNDTYGHSAGDELLRAVADRLRTNTRADDIVARIGGDEFAVVQRVSDEAAAFAMAQRLVAVLSEPYDLSTGRVGIGASGSSLTLDARVWRPG